MGVLAEAPPVEPEFGVHVHAVEAHGHTLAGLAHHEVLAVPRGAAHGMPRGIRPRALPRVERADAGGRDAFAQQAAVARAIEHPDRQQIRAVASHPPRRDAIASLEVPRRAIVRRKRTRAPESFAVQPDFIHIVDLPEQQVEVPAAASLRDRDPPPEPAVDVVAGVAGMMLPIVRQGDHFPGVVIHFALARSGVIPAVEAPPARHGRQFRNGFGWRQVFDAPVVGDIERPPSRIVEGHRFRAGRVPPEEPPISIKRLVARCPGEQRHSRQTVEHQRSCRTTGHFR